MKRMSKEWRRMYNTHEAEPFFFFSSLLLAIEFSLGYHVQHKGSRNLSRKRADGKNS